MTEENFFGRSSKIPRSPPPNQDDSTVVNPNISSCLLCEAQDTCEMVQCGKCNGWFHFQCVGVTLPEILNISWQCPTCSQTEDEAKPRSYNNSVRSSTSSRRRSNLLLEKLAKEKAIAEKFAEDRRKLLEEKEQHLREENEVAKNLVDREFQIRDQMSDSEDDHIDLTENVDGEPQDKNNMVSDWLNNPVGLSKEVKTLLSQPRTIPSKVLLESVRMLNKNQTTDSDQENRFMTGTAIRTLGSAIGESTQQIDLLQPMSKDFSSSPNHAGQTANEEKPGQPYIAPNVSFDSHFIHHSSSNQTFNQNSIQSYTPMVQLQPILSQSHASMMQQSKPSLVPAHALMVNQSQSNWIQPNPHMLQTTQSNSFHTHLPLSQQTLSNQNLVQRSMKNQIPQMMKSFVRPVVPPSSQPLPNQTFVQRPIVNNPPNSQGGSYLHSTTQGINQPPSTGQLPPMNQQGGVHQHTIPVYQAQQPQVLNQTNQSLLNNQSMLSHQQIAARQAMPKDYPKFKGEPENWSIFYSAVITSINTCGLSNAEVLSRLQKCLDGKAKQSVSNLLTIPEAVPEILETLQMIFGRPEVIIDSLIKQLRNEPNPKMDKMETFISFAISVRNVNSEIEKLGMWQYQHNPSLIQELLGRLPYEMRISWGEQKLFNPNADFSHFSNWLFGKARSACVVTLPHQSNQAEKESNKKSSNNSGSFNPHLNGNQSVKTSSFNTPKNSTNSNTKRPVSCQLCENQTHNHCDCPKFLKMNYNERWEAVKEKKLCRCCLGNHHTLSCKNKNLCGEVGCPAKHHRLLHDPTKIGPVVGESLAKKALHTAHQANKTVILRRYIPVTLYGPTESLNVLAFLDEGSDFTLVEEHIANSLGISGTPEDLYLEWTSKIVRKESGSKILTLEISGRTTNKKYSLKQVRTVKRLDLPSQTMDVDQLKNMYKFLRRIPLVSYKDETPKIIIGLMDCKISTPLKVRSGNWEEPIATKTLLGWEVHGSQPDSLNVANINLHFNYESRDPNSDENLHQMVAKFFSLENFGVKKPEQTVEAMSDKRAKELLETTTKRIGDGNKFETGLLWKYDNIWLPNSLPMATKRLESLSRRLERDPDLDMKFRSKMAEYIEKGYVRKLTAEEEKQKSSKIWYLPLFPVFNPKKPAKIRLVFDAAAKVGETSLNSMLLKGPDQLVSLPGVLLRYREGEFAITGDICDMFHRGEIQKEDQMAQRFLWKEKGSKKIEIYMLLVMSFGAACSPASAQYIKNRNAAEHGKEYPRAEIAIRDNHYVDDWLQSFQTEKELVEVAKEVKYVHSKANFEIRNWISNSTEAMSELGENVQPAEQKINFDLDDHQTERVLGMWWNVSQDTFTYSLRYHPINKDVLTGSRRPTKREILRTLMAVYDPLGFLASFLVQLKMLLQDIWRSGIGWDDMISEKDDDNMYDRWSNWIKHLPEIEKINIPRHFSSKIRAGNRPYIELHVFADASILAYATVAYLRIEDDDGVECCLIGGKTKVAPLKPLSIPRMELQAAVLGTRYKNCIRENLTVPIQRNIFWSDSSTVLSWLKSDLRKYSQYVGSRVGEVLESTEVNEWRWVPSKLNPADDATKWKGSLSLDPDSRWFKGPNFLIESEECWPKLPTKLEETMEERKPKRLSAHIKREVEVIEIKFEFYHQWIRTQAFVLRFINNLKARTGKVGYAVKRGALLREELVLAENTFFRKAQQDEFYHEIEQLKANQNLPENKARSVDKRSKLYRYSPYLDQTNVLRVRGRIDAAPNVSHNQKRPIILPTHHQITDLIVKEYHRRYKHQNNETVINEVKQRFMIPRLRALVKRIRRDCQHCKNARVLPLPPQIADLPIGRLSSFTRPFTHVGVDYAGPYKTIMFRKTVKRWIVLFTCLTIRAVHLEYVHSLTTDSCIIAITRFVRKNGSVQEFYSDRGTNFKGADNELNREIRGIDHDKLNVTFTTLYTKWNFNPPLSPHMGGVWERLIGSMKNTLYEILPTTHLPNDETLYTALIEVQNIINSRPLTFVSIEPDDPEALTPNHFLLGSSNGDKPPGEFPLSPTVLRGNWRYAQQIANSFWHRWVKEYLPIITRRTKWFENVKPIKLHDQVIIVDENKPRNTWERGVVVKVIKVGRNGRASKAKVRTLKGIYTRPVCKLAVLDIAKSDTKILTRENLAGGSVTATGDI